MKQIAESEFEKAYKLPADFPIDEFTKDLLVTFNTLADFVTVDEWGVMKIIFLNHVSKSFVSSSYFNGMSEDERLDAIDSLNILRYVLEILADLFTDSVKENSYSIFEYLRTALAQKPEKTVG